MYKIEDMIYTIYIYIKYTQYIILTLSHSISYIAHFIFTFYTISSQTIFSVCEDPREEFHHFTRGIQTSSSSWFWKSPNRFAAMNRPAGKSNHEKKLGVCRRHYETIVRPFHSSASRLAACAWHLKISGLTQKNTPATNEISGHSEQEKTSIINRRWIETRRPGGGGALLKIQTGAPSPSVVRLRGQSAVYPAKVLRGFRYSFSAHVWRWHDVRAPNWIRLVGFPRPTAGVHRPVPRSLAEWNVDDDAVTPCQNQLKRSKPLSQNLTRIR